VGRKIILKCNLEKLDGRIDLINMSQNMNQWRVLVNINFWVPQNIVKLASQEEFSYMEVAC
jgi:hypothetical protein